MGAYVTKCNICNGVAIRPTTTQIKRTTNNEKPTIKILLLGLDNAGKTTTALHLIGDSLEDIIPTIGFSNLEMRKFNQFRVVMYDLGGGPRIRSIWKNYFALIHGIIFVIDSSDISRVLEVKDVIEEVVSNDKIGGKPILVLINKQDIEGALEELDICQYLKLEPLINKFKCPTKIETCIANRRPDKAPKIDPAIDNGYQWLMSFIAKNWFQLNTRVEKDSNEQYSNERNSLEERTKRFRDKRFEDLDKDRTNENEFIKNGNPFKAIEDVIRDVDHRNDKIITNTIDSESKEDNKRSYLTDEESIVKTGSASEGEDIYSQNDSSNESNDVVTQNSKPDQMVSSPIELSNQSKPNDNISNISIVEIHYNQEIKEEIKENKNLRDLESSKTSSVTSSVTSPQSNQKSITSNRSHKESKRKAKVIRNSKVSPDLSQNS